MNWLELSRELQALSQTGLHFAKDHFDRERYSRIGELAAQVLANHSNLAPADFVEWNRREFGYATPKVDVRGVIFSGDRILLIREDADEGRWTLPGGWADVNESPAESVIREVREETGFECRVLNLLAVLDREKQGHQPPFPYHIYKLFFHCEIVGGTPTANRESSALDYFNREALPELSLSRVKPEQIERFFTKIDSSDLSPDFD